MLVYVWKPKMVKCKFFSFFPKHTEKLRRISRQIGGGKKKNINFTRTYVHVRVTVTFVIFLTFF